VEGLDLTRRFYITRRRQRSLPPLGTAFIDFLKENLPNGLNLSSNTSGFKQDGFIPGQIQAREPAVRGVLSVRRSTAEATSQSRIG
jgi:hypothetical protein